MRKVIHAINAATATTTSSPINIGNAKGVSFQFQRSDHSSGNTVFTVSLSNDDSTYTNSSMLLSNTATSNSQTLTRVASYTASSNATGLYVLDPLQAQSFKYLKVTATETTDGTHDVWVGVQYDE